MNHRIWNLENIKSGVELFISSHERMPTARDFDLCSYLPSARQVQRGFGGLSMLRESLGYGRLDFTKGNLRTTISTKASMDGITAEENYEKILVSHFGEAFVHTQKRYGVGSKNRYDFFVYAEDKCFGIDVFTTGRAEYISTNIRHKIKKYQSADSVDVVFLVSGESFRNQDIQTAIRSLPELRKSVHMHVMGHLEFVRYIESFRALVTPKNFRGVALIEQEQK